MPDRKSIGESKLIRDPVFRGTIFAGTLYFLYFLP